MTASSSSAIAASFLSSQSFGSRSLSSFFHHFTSIRSYSSVTFSSSRSIGSIFTRNSCNLDIATRTITRRNHRLFVASSNDNVSLSSKRGRDAPTYLPSYLRDARNVEIYHPTLRPNGALQLSVAENYMMEDLLVPAFSSAHQTSSFSSDLIYYQPTQGREDLRRVLCDSYLPFLLHLEGNGSTSSLNPNNLVVGAGCNAVLENICLCLAEFGEGIMIPTPYYAAFEFDLTCRIGLKIIPVHPYPSLKGSPTRTTPSLDDYYPTFASLENAYALAKDSGIVPRILLLSHPNNPLGIIYPKSVLQEILAWCQSRDMHVISDEIYAGSVFPPTAAAKSSSYEGTEFTSMLHLVTPAMKDQVHWIYALSKDFCLSGLRVGLCYTQNEEILYPLQKLNDLCQVSSITQSILVKLLNTSSTSFPVKFLAEARNRLRARSAKLQAALNILGIPTLPSEAGMFIWMDLQEFLPNSTNRTEEEREHMLYKELIQHGLLFTPGISMKMELPGFFRCVYTAVKSEDEIGLALHRLKNFVEHKRSTSQ